MRDRASTANGRVVTARTSHGFGGVRSSESRRRSHRTAATVAMSTRMMTAHSPMTDWLLILR